MKRALLIALAFVSLLFLVRPSTSSLAKVSEPFKWGSQINQSECPNGTLVVNVTFKVTNDADSGVAGNYWALDNYVKHVQVIQTSPTAQDGTATFCATVSYQGDFTTFAGPSPNNSGTVEAGIIGTSQGGYIAPSFTGTLNSAPTFKTKGNIGTFNYGCDETGNCPGAFDWTAAYFTTSIPLDMVWWGWTYHAGNNGSWVNASGGNSGDITGN